MFNNAKCQINEILGKSTFVKKTLFWVNHVSLFVPVQTKETDCNCVSVSYLLVVFKETFPQNCKNTNWKIN